MDNSEFKNVLVISDNINKEGVNKVLCYKGDL